MEKQPMDNSKPLTNGFNFTPIFNGHRVRMRVSPTDASALGRGKGYHGEVVDLDTGKHYTVWGKPCGLACYCDAEIFEQAQPKEVKSDGHASKGNTRMARRA